MQNSAIHGNQPATPGPENFASDKPVTLALSLAILLSVFGMATTNIAMGVLLLLIVIHWRAVPSGFLTILGVLALHVAVLAVGVIYNSDLIDAGTSLTGVYDGWYGIWKIQGQWRFLALFAPVAVYAARPHLFAGGWWHSCSKFLAIAIASMALLATMQLAASILGFKLPYEITPSRRHASFFENAHTLCGVAMAFMYFSLAKVQTTDQLDTPRKNIYWPLITALCAWTIFSSGQRIHFAAAFLGLLLLLQGRWRIAMVLTAVGFLALVAASQTFLDRLTSSEAISHGFSVREEIWRAGWQAFKSSPVWGIGPGEFRDWINEMYPSGRRNYGEAHNVPLHFMAENGLLGLLSWILLLVVTARQLSGKTGFVHLVWLASLGLVGMFEANWFDAEVLQAHAFLLGLSLAPDVLAAAPEKAVPA